MSDPKTSKESQKQPSQPELSRQSGAPCYVPEADKHASPHRVKAEFLGGESLKEQRDVLFRQIKHDACDYESILDLLAEIIEISKRIGEPSDNFHICVEVFFDNPEYELKPYYDSQGWLSFIDERLSEIHRIY